MRFYAIPSRRNRIIEQRSKRLLVLIAVAVVFISVIVLSAEISPLKPTSNPAVTSEDPAQDQKQNLIDKTADGSTTDLKLPPLTPVQKTTLSDSSKQPLLIGLGAQLGGVLNQRLYKEAPVNLLTSWYNGPEDLAFMRDWQTSVIPDAYASKRSLHLIVWTGDEERLIETKYGQGCGRPYPLSESFADDMKQLATIFNGKGTMYVSMFTEFQTYTCTDNVWQDNANYYSALKDQYRLAQKIFKENAPNAQMSLTWGGWQAAWDDQQKGGGRALFPYFADIMNQSDFQSFQAMDSKSNFQPINDMTRVLHKYGNAKSSKVMLAHYKPDNGSQQTWTNDLNQIFTQSNISQLEASGLFAFSFMDEKNINASEMSYQQAKKVVDTFGS